MLSAACMLRVWVDARLFRVGAHTRTGEEPMSSAGPRRIGKKKTTSQSLVVGKASICGVAVLRSGRFLPTESAHPGSSGHIRSSTSSGQTESNSIRSYSHNTAIIRGSRMHAVRSVLRYDTIHPTKTTRMRHSNSWQQTYHPECDRPTSLVILLPPRRRVDVTLGLEDVDNGRVDIGFFLRNWKARVVSRRCMFDGSLLSRIFLTNELALQIATQLYPDVTPRITTAEEPAGSL